MRAKLPSSILSIIFPQLALFLSPGCVSHTTQDFPSTRIAVPTTLGPRDGNARIFVFRQRQFAGSAAPLYVGPGTLKGLGVLRNGDAFSWETPPGPAAVSAFLYGRRSLLQPTIETEPNVVRFVAVQGQSYFFVWSAFKGLSEISALKAQELFTHGYDLTHISLPIQEVTQNCGPLPPNVADLIIGETLGPIPRIDPPRWLLGVYVPISYSKDPGGEVRENAGHSGAYYNITIRDGKIVGYYHSNANQ